MSETEALSTQPLLRRRRRDLGDSIDRIEAVTLPFLQRFQKFRLRNREERRALAVIVAERFEEEEASGALPVDEQKGFFERLVDWLADPANREKLMEIVAWFVSLLEMFSGTPL